MNKKEIKSVVAELVEFIVKESTSNAAKLSASKYFWPKTQKWSPTVVEFDDIGDYYPFVIWAGKVFNNSLWKNFAREQLTIWESYKKNGWYPSEIKISKNTIRPNHSSVISLFDFQDAILGYYELSLLSRSKKFRAELVFLINNLKKIAKRNGGFLPNKIFTPDFYSHPLSTASPMATGLFAEHVLHFAKDTKNQNMRDCGHKLISRWLNTRTWKTQKLFAPGYSSYFPYFSPFKTTKLMKHNTNMVYAMLVEPQVYKQEIINFLEGLKRFKSKNGGYYAEYNLRSGLVVQSFLDKTQNFSIIDLLLEAAVSCPFLDKKELVQSAQDCADFWLSSKDNTSLIPDYLESTGSAKFKIAKLDQTADFYSSLLRLYSVTGEKKYLNEAKLGAKLLKKYFAHGMWWSRIVSTGTGKVPSNNQAPATDRPVRRNLTKYVGGALRFYLSLWSVLEGKDMYKDKLLWTLSRDR